MARSRVWDIPSEVFLKAVHEAKSVIGTARLLQLPATAAGTIRKRIIHEGIDYGPFSKEALRKRGKSLRMDLSAVLVPGSKVARHHLKRTLLREGFLRNECSECKQPPLWRDQPLVMVLDHINGVNDDNRLENLRLLCPNCNSQTPTFSGRNVGRPIRA